MTESGGCPSNIDQNRVGGCPTKNNNVRYFLLFFFFLLK